MSEEMALPIAKPMPMIQVTAVRPSPLPVPLPEFDGVTNWPGKGEGRGQAVGLVYGSGLFLLMLVVSVIYGLIGAFS